MGSVVLHGKPGLATLHLADGSGVGGASALAPDTLELNLAPGPMAVQTAAALLRDLSAPLLIRMLERVAASLSTGSDSESCFKEEVIGA